MKTWRITVKKQDGNPETYNVTPRTIVAFERHFKVGLASAFANEQKMEHLYWLGWDAERVAGKVVPLFDRWLEEVETVDIDLDTAPLGETA
jgi:hypothetical protein